MSKSTSEEFVQQVRSAIDIVEVISEYVPLKKSGRSMVGLCPFHSEKTPSFHVSAERQFFHCFGCKAGGDVYSFLMQMEQLTFPEALRKLAERAGIPFPTADSQAAENQNTAKLAMYEAHKLAAKLYHHVLTSLPYGEKALAYLRKRGLSEQTIVEYQIGYAPDSWDFLTNRLKKRGFSLPLMVEAGLLARSENGQRIYDRFRGRIMFPIHDTQGEVIGFGGRSLDGSQPKYLNTPETPLFSKSHVVFNLHRSRTAIRKRKQAILFEGYVDVIAAWQAGVQQGVATLGTALTEQQARMIRRNADQVIVCYDGDAAGQEAAEKAVALLQEAGCSVRVAMLPQGVDPDEYIRRNGAEAFSQNVLLQAVPVMAFRLQQLRAKHVLRDEDDQARFVQEALQLIAQLPSPVERDLYERQLAAEFSLSLDAIKAEARKAYRQQKIQQQRDKVTSAWNNSINNGKFTLTKTLPPAHHTAERMLLYYMMRSREVAERVRQECGARFYTDEHSALAAYLYAYYAEGHPEDPGRLIHYVQDEKCKQLASGLAMMECKEHVSDEEISDYIRQVNNYPLRAQLDELRVEQQRLAKQAANEADETARRKTVMEAARLGMRIHELENALKEG